MYGLTCAYNAPLPPSGILHCKPSKTFSLSVAGVENGPVVQLSVFRIDIQRPLSGDTYPFRRNNNEGKDKALQATLHVYAGEKWH